MSTDYVNINTYVSDSIAAISTPLAPGGLGVIRVSGEHAAEISDKVFKSVSGRSLAELEGYHALFGFVYDEKGEKLDECVALRFRAPHSYTGENTVELSCHGGVYILKKVLEALYKAGARPADNGEFTKRAFLNGKLDLAQAESVMDIISARSSSAARAALSVKDGALSKSIGKITEELIDLGSHLSAWADYPDDDIPQVDDDMLSSRLMNAKTVLEKLINGFDAGRIIKEGINTAIVGKPNAGKSTLMNLLSGCERSIVTSFAGTTRDIVEENIMLGNIPLRLADTAGIRETDNPVEKIGVDLARNRLKSSELVFAVFDSSLPLTDEDYELTEAVKDIPNVAVVNKSDLETRVDMDYIRANFKNIVFISALSGEGTKELTEAVEGILGTGNIDFSAGVLYTERQKNDAVRALDCINEAYDAFMMGFTLDAVTVSCEGAVSALLELTGQRASEEIVAQVFEKFCVGK
ncbi:MAG: tRNA uridine-5-carboxymethylaminomethyl(34) synthesis GTPase MnmE [Clostridia bacterium]|nr:tRNA uridine-5-carboxymethylaminomethyl(34) synthesis GTPase MnmE [Clostridia bacterium]